MILKFLILPLLSFFIISFIPKNNINLIKKISLILSFFIFFFNIIIFFKLKFLISYAKYRTFIVYLPYITFWCGIDTISIFFLLLTTFLIPICILVNWESVRFRCKDFTLILFMLEFFLLNIFVCFDLFFFYLFFEGVLIPMFFMIGIWGSRERKIHAAYQFFFYTFFGSILMLLSYLIIFLHVGTGNIDIIKEISFSNNRQLILWLGFFIAFAIKVPMIPFHIWLPEAHVEAPTTGSILLAGILLKLGTYGFLRFLIPIFPYANKYFTPFIFLLCILSIIYGSFSTIRQVDLKKIIAYSSVVHMSFSILGLYTKNIEGLQGSLFLMISHGLISGALFFCIGILYDRYHTRVLYYYGGLAQVMPVYAIIFFVFILSNMGFPGTSGFIGEILILISIFSINHKIAFLIAFSMVFSAVYSLWLYNRIMFGELKNFNYNYKKKNLIFYKIWFNKFSDITKREFLILLPIFFFNILLGIYPNLIFNITNNSLLFLL